MKVLSLFDGMACGMIAMRIAGVEVESYDAYEIDKYAIETAQHNFPMIKEHGDVFLADFTHYKGVDFLIGGSPCTYWSIAQTKNRETVASGMGWELFSQYVRALREAKPKYFIYENNKSMSKAIRASIDETFGFEAALINSALVSAQNRQRLYWVGKRNEDGTYSKVNVEQPTDRGILLKDVLDGAVAMREKAHTIDANYYKGGNFTSPNKQSGKRLMAAEPVACRCRGRVDTSGNGYAKYECREDGKSNTLDTNATNGAMVAEPVGIKHLGSLYGQHSRWGVFDEEGKAPTLTASAGMGGGHLPLIKEPVKVGYVGYAIEFDDEGKPIKAIGKDGKEITPYEVRNGLIAIKGKQYPIKLKDGYYIIRKLTVRECMRLQTVPEWYEFPVSDSQAYKMLGNGWTVDVIAHILKGLKEA